MLIASALLSEGAVANSRFEPISRIFRPLCTAVFRMHVAEIRYLQQHLEQRKL